MAAVLSGRRSMSKFPSKLLLATLSPSDREFLFKMEYEDIKAEISGLVSGYTKPREDETKENRIDAARLRLQKLQKVAAEFKISF